MAASVKEQLEKARTKHQADIDTLKKQIAEMGVETSRQKMRVSISVVMTDGCLCYYISKQGIKIRQFQGY